MYHPYFRGKQYELITVRELAPLLKKAGFCPIIEPVREDLGGLKKALQAVVDAKGQAIVIVNPHHGELSEAGNPLTQLLQSNFPHESGISAGILLKQSITLDQAMICYDQHAAYSPVFVHSGFSEAKALSDRLGNQTKDQCHVFLEQFCGKLYQKHFRNAYRILVRDGFRRMRGKDYEEVEPFSDLHATFKEEEGMEGFGDFLVVGEEFNESGGPAYTVVIHLTFIDPDQDDSMQIYHFKSERQDTPTDPAGKFAEALDKMIEVLDEGMNLALFDPVLAEPGNVTQHRVTRVSVDTRIIDT